MIAAVGGIAFYGYEQGWFANLFPAAAHAAAPAAVIPSAPAAVVTTPAAAPAAVTCPATMASASSAATPASATCPSVFTFTGSPTNAQLTTATALAQANSSGGYLDADQWQYYWNQLGYPAIPTSVFESAFFPGMRPANSSANTQMNALAFVTALGSSGQSTSQEALALLNSLPINPLNVQGFLNAHGVGNYFGIPAGAIHGGW